MRVIIIGAGRMGKTIGYFLVKHGYSLLGVYNKHLNSARQAVELIGAGAAYSRDQLENNLSRADLVVITTPDDQIAATAGHLADYSSGEVYFMHMSGLYSSQILNKENRGNINVFSLHPLQAIAGFSEGKKLLPEAMFTLEGDEKGVTFGRQLMEGLNWDYEVIKSDYKPLYHAAAVIASNYLVTLVHSSYELLTEAELENRKIREGIITLVRGTLSNIQKKGPVEALTGPAARHDLATIENHREVLEKMAPETLELYNLLGRYTARMIGDSELEEVF